MTTETIPSEAKAPEQAQVPPDLLAGSPVGTPPADPEELKRLEYQNSVIKELKSVLYDLFTQLGTVQKEINSVAEVLKSAEKERENLYANICSLPPQS